MSFSFNFGGDEIDDEDIDAVDEGMGGMEVDEDAGGEAELLKPCKLELDDLLFQLPSSLSFRLHGIPTEYGDGRYTANQYPRRDLHDIRAQVMSTADPSAVDAVHEAALSSRGDLTSGIYEGGFKTWECSNDLAWWMLERGPQGVNETVELGAGTALPSCVLLSDIVRGRKERTHADEIKMVLADYNDAVVRMCTFPNMFLTWYCATQEIGAAADPGKGTEVNSRPAGAGAETADALKEGYVEVTEELKQSFLADMQRLRIKLVFVAGSWGSEFSRIVGNELKQAQDTGSRHRCIMASETVYSPKTLDSFTRTVMDLLGSSTQSRAVIAAKRIYFGVGGGVDEFKRRLPAQARFEHEWEGGLGVGRWIGQLQVSS